jgi:hypothetical protein
MTKLYVAEYPGPGALPSGDSNINALPVPPTAEQVIDSTATTGGIATLGAITAGTLYTNGSYTNVPLTGGTGSGATANITVAGGGVTAVTLVNPGLGYTVADALSATAANLGGTGSGFSIPVATITHVSAGFQQSTTLVEVSADGICSIAWGVNPIATVNNCRLVAGERKLVRVPQVAQTVNAPAVPGFRVSVITNT